MDEKTPEAAGKLTIALSKPIRAYDKELHELVLREPTGEDMITIGNPVLLNMFVDPPVITYDMAKVAAMLAKLSNVPSSSIATMDTNDLAGACFVIAPFFVPKMRKTSSPPPSTSA
jgi:hypothetical protein